jgi:hypothetical protein
MICSFSLLAQTGRPKRRRWRRTISRDVEPAGSFANSASDRSRSSGAFARSAWRKVRRHLNSLPQGQPQRDQRTLGMVVAMMNEHFGSCTNHGECEAVCPKEIPLEFIGKMDRDLLQAVFGRRREPLNVPSVVQQPSNEEARTSYDATMKATTIDTG